MSNSYNGISGTVSRRARCDLALEIEALEQSNYIEGEYSDIALKDAIYGWIEFSALPNCVSGGQKQGYLINTRIGEILELHECVMLNMDIRIAGKLRTCDVTVGGRFIPFISETLLKEELAEWIIKHGEANTEESIKEAHIAFERIHPFEDGNGRVGRILMMLQRKQAKLPIRVIHVGKEQQEYYKWFK